MATLKLKIMAVRAHKFVRSFTKGDNCDFTSVPGVQEEFEIVLAEETKWGGQNLWQLRLSSSSGQCGSGWCSASWGNYSLDRVRERGPATHLPNQEIVVELDPEELPEHFECEAFGWSSYGGDEYYPAGGVWLMKELFKKTGRGHTKPVVWIFRGESNLGKSTLAHMFTGLKVYETDQDEELKDEVVYAQVVVLGGKHNHTIDGIRNVFTKHELDVEIVDVSFSAHAA